MDDVSNRCVLLRGLPPVSQSQVETVLNDKFSEQFEKVHEVPEHDEHRWIALFKRKSDAERCIESGAWRCRLQNNEVTITPDYCSDCIVPDEWNRLPSEEESYVLVGNMSESVTSRGSVASEDLFSSMPHPHQQASSGSDESESGRSSSFEVISSTPSDSDSPPVVSPAVDVRKWTNMSSFVSSGMSDDVSSADLFGSGRASRSFRNAKTENHSLGFSMSEHRHGNHSYHRREEEQSGNTSGGASNDASQSHYDVLPLRQPANRDAALYANTGPLTDADEPSDQARQFMPGETSRDSRNSDLSHYDHLPPRQLDHREASSSRGTKPDSGTDDPSVQARQFVSSAEESDRLTEAAESQHQPLPTVSRAHRAGDQLSQPLTAGTQPQSGSQPLHGRGTKPQTQGTGPDTNLGLPSKNAAQNILTDTGRVRLTPATVPAAQATGTPGTTTTAVGMATAPAVMATTAVGMATAPAVMATTAVGMATAPAVMATTAVGMATAPAVMATTAAGGAAIVNHQVVPGNPNFPSPMWQYMPSYPVAGGQTRFPTPHQGFPYAPMMYPVFIDAEGRPLDPQQFPAGQFPPQYFYAGHGGIPPGYNYPGYMEMGARPKTTAAKENPTNDLDPVEQAAAADKNDTDKERPREEARTDISNVPVKDGTIYAKIEDDLLPSLRQPSKTEDKREKPLLPPTGRKLPEIPSPSPGREETRRHHKGRQLPMTSDKGLGPCSIKVSGVHENTSQETLELFFENTRRSGGGLIQDIQFKPESGEAIIQFEDPKVAQKVLQKHGQQPLQLEKRVLEVEAYIPPPADQHKLFISGMKGTTTRECLEDFIEVTCDVLPANILPGGRSGTALVTFSEPQDVWRLKERAQSRRLEGEYLSAMVVPISQCVKLSGLKMPVTEDSIMYYFESKRGGSREVSSVEIQEDANCCIVTFKRHEDAKAVCESQDRMIIERAAVSASLYYEFMEPDTDLSTLTPPTQLVLSDLNQYLVRFLCNSAYKEEFEHELATVQAKVVWPAETGAALALECALPADRAEALEVMEGWESRCSSVVEEFTSSLAVKEDIVVAQEAWSAVLEKLQALNITHPDHVALFVKQEKHGLIIVGQCKLVSSLGKQVQDIITQEEQRLSDEHQSVTKSRSLRIYELKLLRASRFVEDMMKSGISVSVDEESREFKVQGSKKEVDNAWGRLSHHLKGFSRGTMPMCITARDLLYEKETRDYVKTKIIKKKIIGVWDANRRSEAPELHMYGRNDKEVEAAIAIVTKSLPETTFDLDVTMATLLLGEAGQSLLMSLKTKHPGQFAYDLTPKSLYVVAVDLQFQNIVEDIKNLFDLHAVISEFMPLDPGVLRFLQDQRKLDLQKIESQYKRLSIEISIVNKRSRQGMKIQGNKDGCKLAMQKIEALASTVHQEKYKLKGPGVKEFFSSASAYDKLQSIEFSQKCVLQVEAPDLGFRLSQSTNEGPVERASCQIEHRQVRVMEGDMTLLPVKGIINPSRGSLLHTLGLGASIVDKGGHDIQKECSDFVRKNGPLSDGSVIVTKAGRLSCKYILHVALPTWGGGGRNEIQLLETGIKNCLKAADEKNVTSIAFPAVGSGMFKFDVSQAAETIFTAIRSYFRTNSSSSVSEVCVCDIRAESVTAFISSLRDVVGSSKVRLTSEGGQDTGRPRSSVSGNYDELSHDYDDGGVQRRRPAAVADHKIKVSVIRGELSQQQVDVIVNSSNQNLDLSVGAISKALLQAGGTVLQQHCTASYPSGVQLGQVAVTQGGNLQCRCVFHGFLISWDGGRGNSEKVMKTFVNGCLETADKYKLTSIAFPALGAGVLAYPADIVAGFMFDCIRSYEASNPLTSLRQVNLVVFPKDGAVIKAFESVASKRQTQDTRGDRTSRQDVRQKRLTVAEEITSPQPQEGHHVFNFDGLTVEVCNGDLTQEKTGAIVNSVLPDLDLSKGHVSKAILQAAGTSIQQECWSTANLDKMRQQGMVVTGAGRLMCQRIIHVKARSRASKWEETVEQCLQEAEFYGVSSIAFPALGTGGKGCSADSVAKAMFSAIKQFTGSKQRQHSLKKVKILIFQSDMVDSFVDAATGGNPGFFGGLKAKFKRGGSEAEKTQATIHIYTDSSYKCEVIRNKLDALCAPRDVEKRMYPSKKVLETLKYDQESRMNAMALKKNVLLDVRKYSGYLVLRGQEEDVSNTEYDIGRYLQSIEAKIPSSDVKLPRAWGGMGLQDAPKSVVLSPSDREYTTVAQTLTASAQGQLGMANIIQIERIQNPTLYTQYVCKRKQMERQSPGVSLERELWHGTSDLAVNNINSAGFNRNFNSGSSHGAGVYFAVSAATSVGYCQPDTNGYRHIYLAHVLVGEFCQGSQGIRKPPAKSPSNSLVTYDSTTDNVSNPNFFVIFHDSQAYPSYHIMFQ